MRNLTLARSSPRSRGKTIDDESLPNAFKTPTKLLAQSESHKLEHSRSSNDLRSPPPRIGQKKTEDSDTDNSARVRPAAVKLRRRSTLNWSNATPGVRQKKLEDVTGGRLADTWFSLHCSDIPEPIYVSEVVEKAMNPSFRFFDLNAYGPFVTRRDKLTIKYWAKTEKMDEYILLIELQLYLRSLQFIGKSVRLTPKLCRYKSDTDRSPQLENFHHPLPQNCILFHLSDGIYTSFTDLPPDESIIPSSKPSRPPSQGKDSTSSFDALMRLSNLEDCIQDALSTREKLTSQINILIEKNKEALQTVNAASRSQESLAATNRSVSASRKQVKAAQVRRSELQTSLQARRSAISSGTLSQQKAQSHLESAQANLSSRASLLRTTATAITSQIRRICEDLLRIYPIEPIFRKPLSFTIHDLALPNATSHKASDSSDPAVTAAALSLVAHAVLLLSYYLSTAIPYPSTPHGSTSSIFDPISTSLHSTAARTFPLYQKGAVPFRFEYAVFLLNSDIELLMSKQGLRMVDVRHTLPNLKYLLTVLTEGNGDLPIRKKGGIRGLRTSSDGTVKERRDSFQSVETQDSVDGVHKGENGSANGKQAVRLSTVTARR